MSAPIQIKLPDIGDFAEVEVIEVLVAAGQQVAAEAPLLTLESDKATMDIPAPQAGTVAKVLVKVGDMVAEGTPIVLLEAGDSSLIKGGGGITAENDDTEQTAESAVEESASSVPVATPSGAGENPPAAFIKGGEKQSPQPPLSRGGKSNPPGPLYQGGENAPPPSLPPLPQAGGELPHASPAVRKFVRELGADLTRIAGSGNKGRIVKEDVQAWVKAQLQTPAATAAAGIPPIPPVDFAQFGAVETVPLSRIKKLSGPHLQRAWLNAPHVTHHDEADITELEAFRQEIKDEAAATGARLTVLAFAVKILAGAVRQFPSFNASLAPDGAHLILKKYCNIGIAVDTPGGLVVPVLRDADAKSVLQLAREMGEVSARARDGKLTPDDLQGGCITISSLGGIGGTAFTPIINAPEVAILGIARARMMPVWTESADGDSFAPRLMLPLDLSYDHRVIDGAEAARFVAHLVRAFGDVRRLLL